MKNDDCFLKEFAGLGQGSPIRELLRATLFAHVLLNRQRVRCWQSSVQFTYNGNGGRG